ncbi:MAG TPA: transglycosylase family protein [Acidimicrobiales bacterium]|nr:transglycosylase family protein [Acidimicrobiales bacterium]
MELAARVHRRSAISVALLVTLLSIVPVAIVLARPAGADQIGDLKAQAAAISQRLLQDRLEIDAYQQQYSIISQRVTADALGVAALDQEVSQDQQRIALSMQRVREQAIRSYMTADTEASSTVDALFAGNVETEQIAQEYTGIATGNIETALDQLRADQRTLQGDRATLQAQQSRDQGDEEGQATALGQAEDTARQLASLQSQVTGQLATAVAEQAAAQAAKAKAAVVAAQKPVPERSVSTTSGAPTSGAPTPPPSSGSDPALNPFLQCVVQAESGGNYQAVSPDGMYMGAFQFTQATWNLAAQAAGRPDLVGVPPNLASKADQDTVAVALYALDGQQPWLGDRCSS